MTQEAAVPADLISKLQGMWRQDIANANRAASIRNASISSGGTLAISGGALELSDDHYPLAKILYVGPVSPPRADGNAQQGVTVRRADNTVVLALFDANPTDSGGNLNQALNWFDRAGNVVLADDTNSGVGLARPYVPIQLFPSALSGSTSTSATSFTDVWVGLGYRQHPSLYVQVAAGNTVGGATGQVQVLINGSVWGSPQATSSAGGILQWGPLAVSDGSMASLTIEVQAQMTAGTGSVQVVPRACIGMQS